MKTRIHLVPGFRLLALAAWSVLSPLMAEAGQPLICHPYDIGEAQSLPAGPWKGVDPDYDRSNLVPDTLALLTPETPVLVRMETLRRAAIYSTANMRGWGRDGSYTAEDRKIASALLERLRERTTEGNEAGRALALFDLGFFSETLRQAHLDPALDGYALLRKAVELRGHDPVMEFALALASSYPKRQEHVTHLKEARAGAQPGTLLAANLASHFSH